MTESALPAPRFRLAALIAEARRRGRRRNLALASIGLLALLVGGGAAAIHALPGFHVGQGQGSVVAGTWGGVNRRLLIRPNGLGLERVSGIGLTARLRILSVTGTPGNAVARFELTFLRGNRRLSEDRYKRFPTVGQVGRLRLRNGVVIDGLTGASFCGPNAYCR